MIFFHFSSELGYIQRKEKNQNTEGQISNIVKIYSVNIHNGCDNKLCYTIQMHVVHFIKYLFLCCRYFINTVVFARVTLTLGMIYILKS